MQATTDGVHENWHDYEVESRREIIALLRAIASKNQLIRMLLHGEADVCVTAILHIDPEQGLLYLDAPIDKAQRERALVTKRISFETTLDKIRILFAAEELAATTYEERPALCMDIPETMIRLQRREFYRMPTPVSNPVRVTVPMPPELGGGSNVFPLSDISCGGISILDNKLLLGNRIGSTYPGCRIDLPEIGPVVATLQIRNSLDLTLLNNKTNRRLGCAFVDISRGSLSSVQRYITQLERERNARTAGLG